jgi:uncharacterized protein (DUF2132 family)
MRAVREAVGAGLNFMPTKSPSEARDETGHLVRELHGVTLVQILEYLVERIGWKTLGEKVTINCFTSNPSIKSSLVFLRRTPWARSKVESLYIELRSNELAR